MRLKIDGWHESALIELAEDKSVTVTQIVKQLIAEAHDRQGEGNDAVRNN